MTTYKGFSTVNAYKKFRLTDFEIAKQDLYNNFHIRKGEKLMNPKFGTIIWDLLFEPFTTEIQQAVVNDINTIIRYDPRLLVNDVTVSEYEYGLQVDIMLTYVPDNQTEILKLRFDQNSKTATVV